MNINAKNIVVLNKIYFMSTIELLQQKVSILPKEVQLQVLDFVNFLTEKYSQEEDEALVKSFLLQRSQLIKKEKRVNADDLRKKVLKKYNKDV